MVYMLHGMNNSVIVNALLSDLCISAMRVLGSCWKQRTRFGHGYYWLILAIIRINHKFVHVEVRMAEWSKAPDSSSGPLTRAWVQIPLLTNLSTYFLFLFKNCSHVVLYFLFGLLITIRRPYYFSFRICMPQFPPIHYNVATSVFIIYWIYYIRF